MFALLIIILSGIAVYGLLKLPMDFPLETVFREQENSESSKIKEVSECKKDEEHPESSEQGR